MIKAKLYDFIIILLAFVVVATFPYTQIIKDYPFWSTFAVICTYFLLICLIFLFLKFKSNIQIEHPECTPLNGIMFLPVLFVCGSNFFYLIFFPDIIDPIFDGEFVLKIILHLLIAITEEVIFRGLLQSNLQIKNKLLKIVVTAFIFALFHFLPFFTSFDPSTLIMPVYAFGLGIILGMIFEYTGCLYLSIAFHFLFNFFNKVLFVAITGSNDVQYGPFILINVIVSLFAVVYLVSLYSFYLYRKN